MTRIISTMTRRLPSYIKSELNVPLKRLLSNRSDLHNIFLARVGITSDFSGYETLINYIETNNIYELKLFGDWRFHGRRQRQAGQVCLQT